MLHHTDICTLNALIHTFSAFNFPGLWVLCKLWKIFTLCKCLPIIRPLSDSDICSQREWGCSVNCRAMHFTCLNYNNHLAHLSPESTGHWADFLHHHSHAKLLSYLMQTCFLSEKNVTFSTQNLTHCPVFSRRAHWSMLQKLTDKKAFSFLLEPIACLLQAFNWCWGWR